MYFARRREELLNVLNSWIGVPYEHMGETKSGIDCSKLLAEVLQEIGVLTGKKEKVFLPFDWIFQTRKELLLEIVDENIKNFLRPGLKFEILKKDPEFGDLVFFSLLKSGVTNHSGIYTGKNQIFHCLTKRSCMFYSLPECWINRITFIYRLIEV